MSNVQADLETTTPTTTDVRSPAYAWLHRWPLAVVLAVLGAAIGAGVGAGTATLYTVEARVAVGAGDLTTGAIAGFPQAASSLASNYARYVNNRLKAGSAGVTISASPIPDSNIIRIEGASTDRSGTIAEVDKAAENLVNEVNARRDGKSLLTAYHRAATRWGRAVAQQDAVQAELDRLNLRKKPPLARLDELKTELAKATTASASTQLLRDALGTRYADQQRASAAIDLQVVLPGSVVADNHVATVQRYGLVGAVLGLALSLALAVLMERRRTRRHRSTE